MNWLTELNEDELPVVYAVALYDAAISAAKLADLFQARAQTDAMGNPYSQRLLKDVCTGLMRKQILKQEIGIGLLMADGLRMTVILHMFRQGILRTWIAGIRDMLKRLGEYQYWKSYDGAFYGREVQFSVLSGRTDEALLWREKLFSVKNLQGNLPADKFFATDDGVQLFSELRVIDQGMMLTDLFQHANWTLADCGRAYQFGCAQAEKLGAHWPQLISLLCWQAILRGDTASLEKLMPRVSPAYLPELQMVMSVMQNKIAQACSLAQTYSESQRAGTGKRKFFLSGPGGLFAAVALLAKNDAASLKLAKSQIDEGVKQREAYTYFALQPLLNHMQQGTQLPHSAFAVRTTHDVDALFEAHASDWLDAPSHPRLQTKLNDMRDLMQARGYLWIAAEADGLLVKRFSQAPVLSHWHEQAGWRPVLQVLQKEEPWKRALEALSQLRPQTEQKEEAPAEQTRLAWMLEMEFQQLRAEPREQKRNGKAAWSKGRAVALRRLLQEPPAYLTEQDRQITAHAIRRTAGSFGSEYDFDIHKALPLMTGHPAIYWMDAPEVRVDLVRGEVALQLQERGEHIALQLDPYVAPTEQMVWRKETPTRLVVYQSSPEIRQISGILGRGLQVPVSARQQLLDAIAAIAPHMVIHSDLPELASNVKTISADATLYAHLLPLQEGLRLQMLVRPLPEGSWLMPGNGAAVLMGEVDGSMVQAARDLDAEKQKLAEVIAACPALPAAGEMPEWEIHTPEQCLELLSQLRALEDQGLSLIWPEGERYRLNGSRSMQNMRLSIKRQGEWFVAGGELVLDDGKVIALRELLQMMDSAKGRFLKIGEKDWLALTASFQRKLEQLRALGEVNGRGQLRLHPLSANAVAEITDEAAQLTVDTAWQEQLSRLSTLYAFVPEVPAGLQATLREYQLQGFEWLTRLAHWGVGACLADDMGLGKTVQTLALLLHRAAGGPALVVAPVSVAMNWIAEAQKFAPDLKICAYHQRRKLEDPAAYDVVVTSYGLLQTDAKVFARQHWHTVVLDEAQVIKNAATKRSQAAMALEADFRMIATGTPVENHLGELWNLFRFINPGLLGSKEQFNDRFALPVEKGNQQAKQLLKKLIQPFILRRTKTQVLTELPPRTEITLQVELSDEERHVYEALRQEALEKLASSGEGADGSSLKVLTEITRLRRFCCHPSLVLRQQEMQGSKLQVFSDTLTEILDNRHKVLVFSQFVDHLALVREVLEQRDIAYQYLDGSTPPVERKRRVDAFQSGEGDVFLISLKAGGTGLNLTAADYVIHLDPWWNPAVEDQASDRAHRMGQQKPVTIYRLVTSNTIEEKILALHAQKRDLADSLLEGGDASARLDANALLQLLKEGI